MHYERNDPSCSCRRRSRPRPRPTHHHHRLSYLLTPTLAAILIYGSIYRLVVGYICTGMQRQILLGNVIPLGISYLIKYLPMILLLLSRYKETRSLGKCGRMFLTLISVGALNWSKYLKATINVPA